MQFEQRSATAGVRRSVSTIGVVLIAEMGINILLFPILRWLSVLPEGSALAQLCAILEYLTIFFVPFYLANRMNGWTLHELAGYGRPNLSVFVMAICLSVGWNLIATYMGIGLETVLNWFGWSDGASSYAVPDGPAAAALQVIQIAILPPLVEELCYRGFFLRTAQQGMGSWGAIVFTSFVFWMAHDSITIFPLAFGFGLLGGVLRLRYCSLWPSMCGHFVVNGSYLLIQFVQQQCDFGTQMQFSVLFLLVELLCLFLGVGMAVQQGLFRTLREYRRQREVSRKHCVLGTVTSVPFLIALGATFYFIWRVLEVWP
ncbi:MAG: lysostaphin resistance A-like protein [Butyricicoccus sp.]